MQKLFTILKRQGVALLILGASFVGVMWIVQNKRPPGSMTVVEAQAMDMNAMKAPIGVFPVGADKVRERDVGGSEKFPATVVALSDEDVVARVPGLVKDVLVYPGDRVSKGQLLATLEADEFGAKALAGSFVADAKQSQAQSARDSLRRERASLARTEIDVTAYEASVEAAKADLRAAENNVLNADGKVREIAAKKREAFAQLEYARADYSREKELFEGGAISRDDLDKAKKQIDTADAKVAQAEAQRQQAENDLEARKAKRDAAKNMVKQAEARLEGSREAVNVSRSMVSSATSNVTAKEREADAARAAASASRALSSYTELRARDDGVVTDRLVSPGTPVMPGQAVLRVKVDREVRVQADLPQRLASQIIVGSGVRIMVDGRHQDAMVTSVFPFVTGRTRTFRVEAVVPNDVSQWHVGSFAQLEVYTTTPTRVLSIRNEAVKTASDGSSYVWLMVSREGEVLADAIFTCTMHPEVEHIGPGICPECKMDLVLKNSTGNVSVAKTAVKIGVSNSEFTAILDGLSEGDLVTWAGDDGLFPGAAVQVVEWDENGPLELPEGAGMAGMDMGDGDKDMDMDEEMPMGGTDSTMKGHEGHAHGSDDNFTCSMHPDVHESEEGICPDCKMDLVPIEDGGL